MNRRSSIAAALLVSLAVASCRERAPDPEAEVRARFVKEHVFAADAGAAWRLTSNDEVFFDNGWYPLETGKNFIYDNDVWRWMGRTSLLRLHTHKVPMTLSLTGWVPLELVRAPPILTLRWRGRRVDAFVAPAGRFTRDVAITPAMQEGTTYADFAIETTTAAREADVRDLGFAVAEVRWEPAKD